MGDDYEPCDKQPTAAWAVIERLARVHVTHREPNGVAEREREITPSSVQGHHVPWGGAGTGRNEGTSENCISNILFFVCFVALRDVQKVY